MSELNDISAKMNHSMRAIVEETMKDSVREFVQEAESNHEMKRNIVFAFVESHEIDDWEIKEQGQKVLILEEDETREFDTYDEAIEFYLEDIQDDLEVGMLDNEGYYDFYLSKEQLYYLGLQDEYDAQAVYLKEGVPNYEDPEQEVSTEKEIGPIQQEPVFEKVAVEPEENKLNLSQRSERSIYSLKELAKIIDNQLDICEVARELGFDLLKNGQGSFKTMQHSSLVFDVKNNRFYWNSQNINGGVIKLWMQFKNVSFKEAFSELVKRVNLEHPERYVIASETQKKEISPIERHQNLLGQLIENHYNSEQNLKMANVKGYLIKTRGIEADIVQKFIDEKMIFQISDNEGRTQVAFIGRNEEGKICSVCKRSTSSESKFKGDFSGCDYKRGWFYDPTLKVEEVIYEHKLPNPNKTLLVFESNIDMMSYMSLLKLTGRDINQYAYLSCGSISKAQSVTETCQMYGYKKAYIMFDNDFEKGVNNPGLNRAIELSKELNSLGIVARPLVPEKVNDWNDKLKAFKNKEIELNYYREKEDGQAQGSVFQRLKDMKENKTTYKQPVNEGPSKVRTRTKDDISL